MQTFVLYMLLIALLFIIAHIVFSIVMMNSTSKMERLRKSELERQGKKKDTDENDKKIKDMIDNVTSPIVERVIAKRPQNNLLKIQRKLYIAGWAKYFSPIQWKAFTLLMVVLGVALGLFFLPQSKIAGLIAFAVPAIMPTFLLNNSYNNRNETLLMSFPETIRIIAGYLSAGLTLPAACEKAKMGLAPEWRSLVEGFLVRCDTSGILAALDWFKDEVDIMEAREFFATVRLTLELGGSAQSGFEEQAENIQKLLREAMIKKIEKRKIWATALQAPIFLCIIGAFALPVVGSMMDLF